MSDRIVKRQNVDPELDEFFWLVLQDKLAPALRFLEVAEESFNLLADRPQIGTLLKTDDSELKNIRVYPMPSPYRNYLIVYRPTNDGVEILTVVHGARDFGHYLRSIL